MVKLFSVLSRFNPAKILLIGDFMLDTYTRGKVRRISPEAPVPILHVEKEESLPGGAGNVALNVTSLGGKVCVIGRVGEDEPGERLAKALQNDGVDIRALLIEKGFKTPVKSRFIADSQQLMRVDFENLQKVSDAIVEEAIAHFHKIIPEVDIVAISDYGKGFFSKKMLEEIIRVSKKKHIPVVVDPKGDDFSIYAGATLIKPNVTEAYAAAKLSKHAALDEVANILLSITQAEKVLVTRSEQGMSVFSSKNARMDFPVRSKEVIDVTGAGDTVLAMIAMALANNLDIQYAAQLANIAAGIAIERLGCVRVDLSDVASRLLESDLENKIYAEEHLFALQQALKGRRVAILGVDSNLGMSTQLFRSIKRISSTGLEKKLIIYVRDENPNEEFIEQLASLAEVDFIILKTESLKHVCEEIHPDEVYTIEGSELIALQDHLLLLSR